MCKPASNEWPETQLYKKRAHRFSPRHATAPIVCLFAPSFRRLNIKSSQRKSTKHRQQTPTNTRKRQEKGRLIYICAKKSPCQTATPRRAHSDLQANNDNIAQNRLDCGTPPQNPAIPSATAMHLAKTGSRRDPRSTRRALDHPPKTAVFSIKTRRHSAAFPARSPQNICKNIKTIGFTVNL